MTVLTLTGVMSMVLGSYLLLSRSQHLATMRSLTWNSTMPVVEAGIEEALTQIQINGTNRVANNGWTLTDGKYFLKSRNLGESYYTVGFSDTEPPVIVSEGFVRAPLSTNYLSRAVRVGTRLQTMYPRGMIADQGIDLNGRSILVDSFDSSDPRYSTNGQYIASRSKDNGSIVTNSGVKDGLNSANATVRGKVATGPGGNVNIGPNGSIGSTTFVSNPSNQGKIESGAYSDDANFDLPPVLPPYKSGPATPPGGTYGGTNGYDFVVGPGDWLFSSKSQVLKGKVVITGKARIVVTGNAQIDLTGGSDFIYIVPGASLTIYSDIAWPKVGGKGIVNSNARAENLQIIGSPATGKITLGGSSAYIGTVYAPSADLTLNGGAGATSTDFSGAIVSKTVTINGNYNFHYDEALGKRGPSFGYIPVSWDEIRASWSEIQAGGLDLSTLPSL